MSNSWKEWQGRTVDGKFVLGTYQGGSEGSAVFRTRVGSVPVGGGYADAEAEPKKDAAIKLVVADGAEGEGPLQRWQAASRLSHPNLIRILSVGRAAVDGRELVYAVEEFAEENLAQIIPERALAAEEARGMLAPVLGALEFVHGKGLVHGAIRPSNILAVGDQVKLSSDDLRPAKEVPRTISLHDAPEVLTAGISTASDMWSLGMTLVEVLTQRVPVRDPARMSPPEVGSGVPEPFRGIAERCLQLDPAKRCVLREIRNRLEGRVEARPEDRAEGKRAPAAAVPKPAIVEAIAASQKKAAKGPYLLVLAAAILVMIFLMVRPRPSSGPSERQTSSGPPQASSSQTSPPQASSSQTSPSPTTQTAPGEQPPAHAPSSRAQPGAAQTTATDDIVERVLPQVSSSARRTISGKIKVRARVAVDAAGNVTEAKLKDAGPSKYFARVALEAARRWKFAPAPDANRRAWTLLFAFTRARTEVSAARAH